MPDRDITEKHLEAYNDVFADIVNVLLFDGQRRVCPDDLRDARARTLYKTDGKLHEQERDVSKLWVSEGTVRRQRGNCAAYRRKRSAQHPKPVGFGELAACLSPF